MHGVEWKWFSTCMNDGVSEELGLPCGIWCLLGFHVPLSSCPIVVILSHLYSNVDGWRHCEFVFTRHEGLFQSIYLSWPHLLSSCLPWPMMLLRWLSLSSVLNVEWRFPPCEERRAGFVYWQWLLPQGLCGLEWNRALQNPAPPWFTSLLWILVFLTEKGENDIRTFPTGLFKGLSEYICVVLSTGWACDQGSISACCCCGHALCHCGHPWSPQHHFLCTLWAQLRLISDYQLQRNLKVLVRVLQGNRIIGYTELAKIQFSLGNGSWDYGGWGMPRYASYQVETQESWWYNWDQIWRPENQELQCLRAGEEVHPSSRREKDISALLLPFYSFWGSLDWMMPGWTGEHRYSLLSLPIQALLSSRTIHTDTLSNAIFTSYLGPL